MLGSWSWIFFVLLFSLSGRADPAATTSLLRRGEVRAALEQARVDVGARPDDVEANEVLIDILSALGMGGDAVAYYQQRAGEKPSSAQRQYLLGRALIDGEEARQAFSKALELDPKMARAHMGLGAVAKAYGDLASAEVSFQRALQIDPTLSEAWFGLWTIELMRGERDQARQTASQAVAAVPGDPDAYLILAELDPAGALGILRTGVANVPDDPRLFHALARVHFQERRWASAIAAYDQGLALVPDHGDMLTERAVVREIALGSLSPTGGQILLEVRKLVRTSPQQAMIQLDGVVRDNPGSARAVLARGNLRLQQGSLTGAEADLRAALQLNPDLDEAGAALGLVLLQKGDAAAAFPLLERASAAMPYQIDLALAAAMASGAVLGPAEAELRLREVAARFPDEPRVYVALANHLVAAGNAEGAFSVLLTAAERIPDPDLLLALAAVAHKTGRTAQTIELLRKASGTFGDPRLDEARRRLEALK